MKHFGIISALPAEARFIHKNKIVVKRQIHVQDNLSLYVCGIGPDNAADACNALLDTKINHLVSWGTAGAISSDLKSGDVILPDTIMNNTNKNYMCDEKWRHNVLTKLEQSHLNVFSGTIYSADSVISPDDKRRIRGQTQAIAVDMESATIASIANQSSIPFIAIRTIVDESTMYIPASILNNIDDYGQVKISKLSYSLFTHPGDIHMVYRLGRSMHKANQSLAIIGNNIFDLLV